MLFIFILKSSIIESLEKGVVGVRKSVAIFGLGRFGEALVREFYKMKVDVIVVDTNEEKVNAHMNLAEYAYCANAADEQVLAKIGIKNVDQVFVAIGTDVLASILISLSLKEMGVAEVWAKANDENHSKILEKIGVDHIIRPEKESAQRIARHSLSNKMIEFLTISEDYSVVELLATKKIDGKQLGELDLRARYGCTIAGIHRNEEFIISPAPEEVFHADDILIIIGHNNDIARVEKEVI